MLALVVIAAVCAGLVAIARRGAAAPATSDTAVIESYTLMATQGRLLVGAYSRFQWHHPGPLYFYLLAPFYAASGDKTTGLNAGSAALSIGSMVLMTAVLYRRKPGMAVLAGAGLAAFAWRAADATASPWNPHVPVLPIAASIVLAADVIAGEDRVLPLVALLTSLAAQAHVALLPCALVIGAAAALHAVRGALQGRDRARWRWSLAWTAATLAVVWALPAYEQITGQPRGNLTELWQFFLHQAGHGQTLPVAVSAWSDMLVGVLRPDFYVAQGWPYVESPVHWAEWVVIADIAVLVTAAALRWRSGDTFAAVLCALLVTASAVALWSATRIEDRVFDHDVFWMTGIGVLNVAVAAERLIAAATSGAASTVGLAPVRWIVCMLLAAACLPPAIAVDARTRQSFTPPPDALAARQLAGDLEHFIDQEAVMRPLIKIDQDAWGIAAGAILELQKRGRPVAVEEDWVVMFTPEFRPNGREDAVVTVAMMPEHLRLTDRGVRLISAHEPVFAHAELSGPR